MAMYVQQQRPDIQIKNRMETTGPYFENLYDKLRNPVDILRDDIESYAIEMVEELDNCHLKWMRTEQELGSCKESLTKTETERGALEVKLKHACSQVDVEIGRRQKAEADCDKLRRHFQLIWDLLTSEGSSTTQLSDEQRSALGLLNTNCHAVTNLNQNQNQNQNPSRRSQRIDESASIMADVSCNNTDDCIRSLRNHVDGPAPEAKPIRYTGRPSEMDIVTKTTVTVPTGVGPVEAVSTIEAGTLQTGNTGKTAAMDWNSESVKSEHVFKQPVNPIRLHKFVSRTVIKPETCVPCGRKIKFGKMSVRCRDCKVVSHPECRGRCPLPCVSNLTVKNGNGELADFVPLSSPMIPHLVVHCISEIEQRGLHEAGLYRVCGADRAVKELKEKFVRGKTTPALSKVGDIHVVTGVLMDFLMNLKEPLLTFRLNRPFMEAAGVLDDDHSIALMHKIIGELPQPNRDTLAFLVLHLQRVAESVDTRMNVTNLARVFGPNIVGHAVPLPDPMTMLQDTKRQPKVVERLLGLPVDYWSQFVMAEHEQQNLDHLVIENPNCYATPERMSMLGPLTTPEHQFNQTPSTSSLSQRMKSSLTPRFGSKSKSTVEYYRQKRFFASPFFS